MKLSKKRMGKNEMISFLFFQLMDSWTDIYLQKNEKMQKNGSSDRDRLLLAMKFASFCSEVDNAFRQFHGCFSVTWAAKRFKKAIQ